MRIMDLCGMSKSIEPRPGRVTRFRRFLFRPRVLLFVAGVVSATVVVPMLRERLPDLRRAPDYRVGLADIHITEPPRWVPHDLVEQVLKQAGLSAERLSLLDDDLTPTLHEAFRRHPWVAAVVRVRKSRPRRVDVDLVYRRPVAMVAVQGGMYPVDADGTLLPPTDFSLSDTGRYPQIRNVPSPPQGPAGTNWGDLAVLGAARLADALLQSPPGKPSYWKTLHLAAIRVPDGAGEQAALEELSFDLLTEGGSRIVWGRAPGSGHPGELSVEQKIGRLEKYLADFGSFDHPCPYEIDIRHWQEISRRPLSAADALPRR